MTLEIQGQVWDRHINVAGFNRLMGYQPSTLDRWQRLYIYIHSNLWICLLYCTWNYHDTVGTIIVAIEVQHLWTPDRIPDFYLGGRGQIIHFFIIFVVRLLFMFKLMLVLLFLYQNHLFSTIFLLEFGIVPTVWYFLFFIFRFGCVPPMLLYKQMYIVQAVIGIYIKQTE